ncbi:ankyrin repeat domain-containing protein [Paraflavitalea sp. CAU 1676]|nr:ankyrin repeat domain-containing protein [Paraflavitalea sp. CAU 1676]
MQQQWLKRFTTGGHQLEIYFDPTAMKVVSRFQQDGKLTEKFIDCPHLINAIWTYDEHLEELKNTYPDLTYTHLPEVNPAASRTLMDLLDDKPENYATPELLHKLTALLDEGADVNLSAYSHGRALLSVAQLDVSIGKLLIERGAAIDVIETRLTWYYQPGATPLHKALLKSSMPVAVLLRDAGANLDFHFNIAVLNALQTINANASMGWKSKDIFAEHKKTWAKVIDTLISWGVQPGPSYQELQDMLKKDTVPYAQAIQSLMDFSKAGWLSQFTATVQEFSIKQRNKLILRVLGHPNALKHNDWVKAMETIIDAQPCFEDVAEEVYGTRVSQTDDEGWLCQSWDSGNYSNIEALLSVLKKKDAVNHPAWFGLMKKLIDDYDEYDSDLTAIEDFLNEKTVSSHQQQPALVKKLEKYL